MRKLCLALLCVGCGSSSGTTPAVDAPATAADAPLPDAPPPPTGPLTVTVLDALGTPIAGATVVTQLATGEVLRVATTDGNGHAATLTVAGGSATTGFLEPDGPRLVTAMGLQFGQAVTLRARPPLDKVAINADIEPPTPVTGAIRYLVQVPCLRHPQTSVFGTSVLVTDDCLVDGMWSAAITALGDAGQPLAYTFVAAIPAATTMPAFPDWKTDLTTVHVPLSDAPITCASCAQLTSFRRTAGGLRYDGATVLLPLTQGEGVTLVVPFAPSLPTAEDGVSLAITFNDNLTGTVRVTYNAAVVTDPVPLSSLLPTQIGGVTVDATGSRLVVSWTTAATGRGPAVALAEVTWKAVNGDGGVENRAWTVLAPPDPKTLALPLLPPELGAFAPSLPGDVGDYGATLTLAADTAFAAYGDFLAADWLAELGGTGPVRGAGRIVALMKRTP